MENDLGENENWFELAGVRVIEGSIYRESTVLLSSSKSLLTRSPKL